MEVMDNQLEQIIGTEELRVFCVKWNIDSIVLFGSILTEEFNEASDIDIALLGEVQYSLKELLQIELFFESKFNRMIDVVDLKGDTLDIFVKINILNTGKILHTLDAAKSLEQLIDEVEWYYRENERYFFLRRRELLL